MAHRKIQNPFGDGDDDDDDEGVNNPFAASSKKKATPKKQIGKGNSSDLDERPDNSHVRSKTIGASVTSNPFGDDVSTPSNPFEAKRSIGTNNPVSKAYQQQSNVASTHVRSKTAMSLQTPVDPFESDLAGNKNAASKGNATQDLDDFDPDFRSSAGRKKSLFGGDKRKASNLKRGSTSESALMPIVAGMDMDADIDGNEGKWMAGVSKERNKSITHSRSRSDASSVSSRRKSEVLVGGENKLGRGWLRGNKNVDDDEFDVGGKEKEKVTVGGKEKKKDVQKIQRQALKRVEADKFLGVKQMVVQRWLYDDYHKEQEKYYKSLQEHVPAGGKKGRNMGIFGGDSDSEDENGNEKKSNDFDANGKFFERPSELPGIKETVQNLSFFEFEKKAEERAINIVSTWLFDAGLIDELLVNGANRSHQSPASASITSSSVMSSEGVEVGAHGFPIEGALKIDKEVEKLRASAQRELTLINTRLNDGVAASGSEVQELVNAVSATQNDLGRLRELTTYVSSGYRKKGDKSSKNEMLLAEFPRLKRSINARRNIFLCFRQLEFFANIPTKCDALREELHEGEWTENEWNTIRSVSMEHVELEILLVEAERGMKAWFEDDEPEGDDDASMPSILSHRSLMRSWKNANSSLCSHYEVVDQFLSQHVKNVWELGDEIRMRILSGVGSSYDIALKNPAGMVALVEAVEVYERAADQYKKVHADDQQSAAGDKNRLHFTDMRARALAQLYQDFELRGLEVFRAIHMQAADVVDGADPQDALNAQFKAVLMAATSLVTEIDVVKLQMAPCFAPSWHVEMLWSSCVAHVCSNQIIQQIGGPEGQNLPDLTVTQLLDLLAWVEYFRETIEEAFPSIASKDAKKTYFDEKPDLFAGDSKEVNMENATDNLVWVNNMLWEIHRLAQDEFLIRTRKQTDDWLNNVYDAERETRQTNEGRLMTSLCEDVFSLATVQLRTIREHLTRKSEALVLVVSLIFSRLRVKQTNARNKFLGNLENCCAAANDFQRMVEQCEDVLQDIFDHCDLSEESTNSLELSCGELITLYSADAVFASQKTHGYIFKPIGETIAEDLFSPKWESGSDNELALILTRTLEDFMGDLETFLDEFMLKKAVNALVTSSVMFYIKCLLERAEKHNNNRVTAFNDIGVAFEQMFRDIQLIRDYFEGLAEGMPALTKHIEKEFEVLTTMQELMRIAAVETEESEDNARDFIVVLHKAIKDINVTKHVVGDLWHLVSPMKEKTIWELTESLEDTLIAVCPPDEALAQKNNRLNIGGLRLDETLAHFYMQTKRKRPVPVVKVEKVVAAMKKTWQTQG